MQTIDVGTHIHTPTERVWEFFSDYEGYTSFKDVSKAKLLQEGSSEKNGVGAVRMFRVTGVTFKEDQMTFLISTSEHRNNTTIWPVFTSFGLFVALLERIRSLAAAPT